MRLIFYGGVEGFVTGANYMLDAGSFKMLVECGLAQGSRYAETLNYEPFKYDPKDIKFVFITHSHIDHMGRLPKLYKDGFRGRVITTAATRDLMIAAYPDSQNRLAEDARQNGGIEPLYDMDDVAGITALLEGVDYDQHIDLGDDISVTFHDAGHILGSSIIEFNWPTESGRRCNIFFSGDLGNPPTPLLRPTEFVHDADYVVIESAYGDRVHEDRSQRKEKLRTIIRETITAGGTLMIPSFALERTQELLFELNDMINTKSIPEVPTFVDSPLAIKLTEVYERYPKYFNERSNDMINSGDDIFKFPKLHITKSVDDSKAINDVPAPKIIIAGSGMSNGGRILHHELRYLSDPKSTILFVGYQAAGSLGRKIFDGAKEVTILGQHVKVNCQVHAIGGYSAHADQPALLKWVSEASKPARPDARLNDKVGQDSGHSGGGGHLKKVFVVQGEEKAAGALAEKIKEESHVEAVLPKAGEVFELS